ncbi:Stp1/IreP family PP2C-type Ser/Thr phosphatase [Rhodoferax sp. PAMC 29310]|uniref:Stp1/IreP family PP2C-type Ser/Thr phosphatase n=1 Tax=Rhodoferax sp. PAMC 29310 TaxID=2822760 RepID=UPI001B31953E|nr:Stp1/IreP family PP2C-type Ser/Thr phosphatase [Rhodoferax sp. PAMC 29310]
MQYHFCAQTDAGRVRQKNEDAVAFDVKTSVGVLADGMGGYNAGEVASGMATAFIKTELTKWLSEAGALAQPAQLKRAMEICVHNTNLAIYKSAIANPPYSGMGTTLVLCVFLGERLLLGHVGDSRCYRLRDGVCERITKDHSFLQEQIDAGLMTPLQAASSPNKNLVTRALGVEDTVLLDLAQHEVHSNDLYLLCSDGLSDMIFEEEIREILQNEEPLEGKASSLVALANVKGGRDNISVLLVQVSGGSDKRGLISRLLGK